MHYQAVVDRFPIPIALDPIAAGIFVAVFVAVALGTKRRPSYGLAALLFVQPFSWYHYVFSTTITFPKIVLIGVIAGLVQSPGIGGVLREHRLRAVAWPLALLAIATALSAFHAHDRFAVLREVFKYAEYLALGTSAYIAFRLDRDDRLFHTSFAASAIIVALSALAQEVFGASFGACFHNHAVPRISGLLEGPNQLAGYIEVATAILGAWSLRRNSRVGTLALALCGCTLMLTFSRGGIFGNGVDVAVLIFAGGPSALRALAPYGAGIAFGALGAAAWAVPAQFTGLLRETCAQSNYAGGVGNRAELWRAALYFFRTQSFTGIGAGNFELDLSRAGVYGVRTHANSWYLQSLAEGGIVLFAAVVAFVTATLRTLRRGIKDNAWSCAAFAATLALALHQFLDYIIFYPKVGGPWILVIALGVAALVQSRA